MNKIRSIAALLMAAALVFAMTGCEAGSNGSRQSVAAPVDYDGAHRLTLSDTDVYYDGVKVSEFDYVWNVDPAGTYDEVKDCPAEYYTGEVSTSDAVYIAHDIKYYPEIAEENFEKANYDGETEWVTHYQSEEYGDYLFGTLPVLGDELPTEMMHSAKEAYNNPVLHITQAGTYILEGEWNGQILVDLGDKDDTFADENAKVTIVMGGVDVNCTVAPAFLAESAYESDNGWEDREKYSGDVDINSDAGVRVVIADDTENSFTGANVYRMLKAKYKSDDDDSELPVQKKARKNDAAFYSCVSMTFEGGEKQTGVLNINATTFEGCDTELHMTINSGNINIYSQDDGINVNEDDVSVFTMNGGSLHIYAGLGAEGDGIDSNGYITVNGGTLIAVASPYSDNGLDSGCETDIRGGTVVALGSNMGGSAYTVFVNGEQQYTSGGNNPMGGGFGGGNNPMGGGNVSFSDAFGGNGMTPPGGFGGDMTPPDGFGGGNAQSAPQA